MISNLSDEVKDLILESSTIMPEKGLGDMLVETKSKNSLVTEIDRKIEKRLVQGLSKIIPSSGFIAEEGTSTKKSDEYNWIIDPLDGTTNFIHGIPHYCISIGLQKKEELIYGCIYEFNQKDFYMAEKGGGSSLNGEKIVCSQSTFLEDSLLATGFPYYDFKDIDKFLALIRSLMLQTRGLRRLGSAAFDLAYVASGKFDGFFEYGLHPWDVAAGVILVQEAGGMVTDFSGNENYLFGKQIVASNVHIQNELLHIIERHFS